MKDNKIVYFTTPDWRNSCRQQNTILSHHHYNKFNKIHHIPINQLSVTNKTLPELNYSPINPAFNALLSKVGSKVYSAIASLFSLLGPSNKKHKSVAQEVKKEVVETQKNNENSINNPITSTESQPFTSLITKVTEHSTSALSVLGHTAISTASTVIKSCQEGSKYNLCAGKTSNIINLLLQIPCTIFLGSCIQNNYYLATQILLLLGTDPNSTLSTFTPLEYAILFNRDKIAKLLIENGANIESRDSEGNTPLFIAVKKGFTDITQLLIENGADINIRTKDNKNALHLAIIKTCTNLMTLLLKNHIDINAKDNKGYPPLYYAITNKWFDKADATKLLLQHKAKVDFCTQDVNNPLLLAVIHLNYYALYALIQEPELCNKIDDLDQHGYNALHYLLSGGDFFFDAHRISVSQVDTKFIKLLLEHKANVNLPQKNGYTPIILAAKNAFPEAIVLLCNYRANVNAQDDKGNTALHYVVSYGREGDPHKNNAIECLIKNGANLSLKNRQGLTPIQIAINNKKYDIAFYILECYQHLLQDMKNDQACMILILQAAKEQLITQLEENNIVKIYLTLTSWHFSNTKSARSDIRNPLDHPQQVVNEREEYKGESEEEEENKVTEEENKVTEEENKVTEEENKVTEEENNVTEEGYEVAQAVVGVDVLGNSSTDA